MAGPDGRWRFPKPRFVAVLAALLAALVLAPVLESAAHPTLGRMLGVLGLFVPVLAIAAAGDVGKPRRIAVALALLCMLVNVDAVGELGVLPPQTGSVLAVVFLGFTTIRLMAGVIRAREVTRDVIAGALASYMMVGLTWAFAYGLLELVHPGSLSAAQGGGAPLGLATLLYFSYVTLLTIGYGDISPVAPAARTLAVLEGLVGMTFTTVILALLVAVHLQDRRRPGAGQG